VDRNKYMSSFLETKERGLLGWRRGSEWSVPADKRSVQSITVFFNIILENEY
jgi:hypothetical protein